MKRRVNPNYIHLYRSKGKYRGAILSGSSRSGKTYSSIHFIIKLCAEAITPITINIVKETYNSFKTTLYDDFNRILPDFGLYSPFDDKKEVDSFKILNSKINLLGADKPSKFHGASCDYLYFNEMLDISNDVFDQAEMRCRVFWWGDFNPKYTIHWLINKVINRPDVSIIKTTWKDNPYISDAEKNKILSYEPTPTNINNGTSDEYMWSVYGLGVQGEVEGLIYKHVNYINGFPEDIGYVYAMDYGFVNDKTSLVKVAMTDTDIFVELLIYEAIDNPITLNAMLVMVIDDKNLPIVGDSSDRYISEGTGLVKMTRDLQAYGWNISKVHKTKDKMYWIMKVKEKRLNVVSNALVGYAKNELQSYRYKTINDVVINQAEDGNDHFCDSLLYGVNSLSRPSLEFI